MGVSSLPNGVRQALAAEVQALLDEPSEKGSNKKKWSLKRLGHELGCSGEAVRDAQIGNGGPKVLDGLLAFRGWKLADLLKKHPQPDMDELSLLMAGAGERHLERPARYDSRESAIQTHMRYGERGEAEIRAAADAVAVALHADEDPGERYWYEQIDAELKRKRPRLGVREITEDDVTSPRKRK